MYDIYAPPSLAGSLPCSPEPASHPWHPQRFQDRCGSTSAAVHSYYDELPGLGCFRWLSLLNNWQLSMEWHAIPKIDFFGKIWPSGNSTAAAFGLFTGDSAISHCTGWIASVLLRSNDHVCKIQQPPGHDSRNTAANALWADEGSDWISIIQVVMSSDVALLFVSLQV